MPKPPVNASDVLKSIQLKREWWEKLDFVAKALHISRTEAVNRAIKWMVENRRVPGFTKEAKL